MRLKIGGKVWSRKNLLGNSWGSPHIWIRDEGGAGPGGWGGVGSVPTTIGAKLFEARNSTPACLCDRFDVKSLRSNLASPRHVQCLCDRFEAKSQRIDVRRL